MNLSLGQLKSILPQARSRDPLARRPLAHPLRDWSILLTLFVVALSGAVVIAFLIYSWVEEGTLVTPPQGEGVRGGGFTPEALQTFLSQAEEKERRHKEVLSSPSSLVDPSK